MELTDLNGRRVINIAGESVEVNKGDSVKDTIKAKLSERGINSFIIVVDGEEITASSELPETFDDHMVEVRKYAKPGTISGC